MEQVAALQLRHDKAYKIFISAGHMGRRDHETVAAATREPLFELVRDHLRRPDKGRHLTHRSSATEVDEIAHRRIGLAAGGNDAVADGLQAADRLEFLGRKRLVRWFGSKVEIKHFR